MDLSVRERTIVSSKSANKKGREGGEMRNRREGVHEGGRERGRRKGKKEKTRCHILVGIKGQSLSAKARGWRRAVRCEVRVEVRNSREDMLSP
jgi:hypothetical protein